MKRRREVITFIGGNTEKFKKDLFKELEGEVFDDVFQLQDRLEEIARDTIKDYIYFESKEILQSDEVAEGEVIQAAKNILKRHKDAFKELAK